MYLLLLCSMFAFCVCDQTILYNTHSDLRVATISNGRKIHAQILVKELRYASSIAYLYNASLICWVEEDDTKLECGSFHGNSVSNRVVYSKMVPSSEGIACDWLTKKLYWTDRAERRIEVLSLESKHRKVLYWEEIDQPRGIAVDPTEGLLFWTDWGETPAIERASMDGDSSLRIRIVEKDLFWPNSVTLDVRTKKLYWIDGKYCRIEVTNYDGGERVPLVVKGLQYPHAYPYSLSVADPKFYWTDWGTHSVYTTDRTTGTQFVDVLIQSTEHHPIFDVQIYDGSLQPYAPTPCDRNNGGCSHLCLLSAGPKRYSCACPTGIRLLSPKTCANEEENMLFLLQRTEIRRVSLDTPDHTSVQLPVHVKHAIGVDVDPVDRYFYWSDHEAQSISRARYDGSHEETIVSSGIETVDGIAVDWIAKNLYWCDGTANRIEMIRVKTNYRRVVVFENILKPRAVVVSPQLGWLFWTEWSEERPKIERSDLDGTNRLVLVVTDIRWPNGLALDYESKKLYFGDARMDRIEVINLDGGDRKVVVKEELLHVFGLSVLDDFLYWTDWSRRTLESTNKTAPAPNRSTLIEQLPDVMGLKAISRHAPQGTNPCAANNGGCAHFCLYKPTYHRHVCVCQVEFELSSDMRSCSLVDRYFMLYSNNTLRRMSVHTNNTDRIPIDEFKNISAIDVSPTDRRVYWANSKSKTINRGYINGTGSETIVPCGLHSPESVSVDWLSWNVYWADATLRRIEVVSLNEDFQMRRTLFWGELNEPRNLVVDPRVGFMFWSEWDRVSGTIVKAHMDGSAKRTIVEDIGRVNGLSIDYTLKDLYWTHFKSETGYIEKCDAFGQNRKVIKEYDSAPSLISHSYGNLFWTINSSIIQFQINSETVKTLHTLPNPVSNLSVVDSAKKGGWNNCVMNNKCKHLCLVRPTFEGHSNEPTCACPTHYTLRGDACQPPENFLLFSHRNALFRLTTNTSECPDFPMLVPGYKAVRAIEYDSATKRVYWIEGGNSKTNKTSVIKRSTEKEHSVGMILSSQEDLHFYDIAIEPFNKLLFWTSAATNTINVTRLDNTSVGCIFEGRKDERPRNLAIYPEKGLLFWTINGTQSRIVQARLNGDDQQTIETEGRIADALAIDRRSGILYLTFSGRLYAYNIADRIRRALSERVSGKVFSLAVMRSWLYWVSRDTEIQRIERVSVNVNTVSDRTVIIQQSESFYMPHIVDLIAVDPKDDSYPHHPCSKVNNHGNCSHLCLPSTVNLQEAECGCPLTLELSDDRQTCIVPLPLTPPPTIEPEREAAGCRLENGVKVCDGVTDCPEGSEESGGSCSDKSIAMKDKYQESSSSGIQFLIAFAILLSLAFVGICFYCKQRADEDDDKQDTAVMRPLAMNGPRVCQSTLVTSPTVHSSISLINGPSSVISYPPSHISGISSSSSVIHCPLNPPPSPTTTTMNQDECSCQAKRGYIDPVPMPMPMPTPCSTDVCESDTSYPSFRLPYVSDRRSRSRRQNRHQHQQRLQNNNYEDMPYRSSEDVPPPPPPPTPNNLQMYNYANSYC